MCPSLVEAAGDVVKAPPKVLDAHRAWRNIADFLVGGGVAHRLSGGGRSALETDTVEEVLGGDDEGETMTMHSWFDGDRLGGM